MHNRFATQSLNSANHIESSFEPFVFLPTTVIVRAEVVVIDLGCALGHEVFVALFAAQINDVGDALVDPGLKLFLANGRARGVEIAAHSEPIVDVAKAPMPGSRVGDVLCRFHSGETHAGPLNVHRLQDKNLGNRDCSVDCFLSSNFKREIAPFWQARAGSILGG